MQSTNDSHLSKMSRLRCLYGVKDGIISAVSTQCTVHSKLTINKIPLIFMVYQVLGNILSIFMNLLSLSY